MASARHTLIYSSLPVKTGFDAGLVSQSAYASQRPTQHPKKRPIPAPRCFVSRKILLYRSTMESVTNCSSAWDDDPLFRQWLLSRFVKMPLGPQCVLPESLRIRLEGPFNVGDPTYLLEMWTVCGFSSPTLVKCNR